MLTTQPTVELGKLKLGIPHSFTYTLKNDYKEPVTITALVKGCGSCTEASVNKQIIGVGDSTDINVIFTPGSTGLNNKIINVQYTIGHDNAKNHITLNFKSIVE